MMEDLTKGCAFFAATSLLSLLYTQSSCRKRNRDIKPTKCCGAPVVPFKSPENVYDAVIVGAGPAGATAAYFMGLQGLRVALIDKKAFPRPKPCGDAWCKPALDILEEMHVLELMEKDGITRPVKRGGFISPFGYKCINTDGSAYGSVTGCKTYAIKRFIADEYLVKAAAALPSVDFFPLTEVIDLQFLSSSSSSSSAVGRWEATTKSGTLPISICGTMCLICDGSTSYLAQKVGSGEPVPCA
jgi:flavin-dependent dehydrogenase